MILIPAVLLLLGIGGKSWRYVIHILELKSSRNALGHVCCASERSSSTGVVGAGKADGYSCPNNQMLFIVSVFFGSGSHR